MSRHHNGPQIDYDAAMPRNLGSLKRSIAIAYRKFCRVNQMEPHDKSWSEQRAEARKK